MKQICSVENCDLEAGSGHAPKHLCNKHYLRLRRLGSVTLPVRVALSCSICGDSVHAKGLCSVHYWRERNAIQRERRLGKDTLLDDKDFWSKCDAYFAERFSL